MVFRTGCVEGLVCGGTHFWGRKLEEMGLPARLRPPKWVRAYVVNNKTVINDSEAIGGASQWPRVHAVPVTGTTEYWKVTSRGDCIGEIVN